MSMDKFTKANSIDELLGTSAAAHAGWDEALLRDGRRLWIEPTVDAGEQGRTTTYIDGLAYMDMLTGSPAPTPPCTSANAA